MIVEAVLTLIAQNPGGLVPWWVPLAIALVGSGGVAAMYVQIKRTPAEVSSINISSTEKLVVMRDDFIEILQAERERQALQIQRLEEREADRVEQMHRLEQKVEALEAEASSVEELRRRVTDLERERVRLNRELDAARAENDELRRRLDAVEHLGGTPPTDERGSDDRSL